MTFEWRPFPELLSDIVDNRGRTCPIGEVGLPLIATNCIKPDRLFPVYETDRYVSQETYDHWFRGHPLSGDILFVCKGSPGRTSWVPDPVDFCIAQDMVAVRPNPDRIVAKYLLAALRSPSVQHQISTMHVGTLIPHFKKGDFGKLLIPVPDRSTQQLVGDFYFDLSLRIEHNRALAANLEAIARALFKSWFVDFDPVRAKAAGEAPKGLAPDLAALFPDRFVDSELGEIPEGWEFTPLSKLAEFVNGRNFTKEATGSGRVVIRIAELSNGGPSGNTVWNDLPDTEDRYVANPGDVLFAWSGSLGVHVWEHDAGLVNQHIFKVLPRSRYCKPFCFFAVEEIIEDFRAIASGKAVTMGHIKRGDLDTHGVVCPAVGALTDAFSNLVGPIWERARAAQRESLALTAMRDLLLPRLISGKLRVEDAEAVLEAA